MNYRKWKNKKRNYWIFHFQMLPPRRVVNKWQHTKKMLGIYWNYKKNQKIFFFNFLKIMIEDSGVENLLLCTPLSSLISSPHDGWIPPVSRTLFLPVPSTVYVDIKLWAQHSITGSWSQGFCITPFHTYTLLGVGMVACWEYRGCKSTSTYFLEQIYGGRCPPSATRCLVFF